jgi:hypothetical protein
MRRREFIFGLAATAALPLAARADTARVYHVSPHLFADAYKDYDHEPIRVAMGQLIDRYGIRGKRVLALGAGSCFEERWFVSLGGNQLTVIDVDAHKSAEPLLKRSAPGPMTYIVGDALEIDAGEHDVLYASGFTPDEMRRYDLVEPGDGPTRIWQSPWEPFHPALMQHASRLTPGGLMIVQSIGYSLDTDAHPQYVPACQRQLARNGFRLIELWRFKPSHGVMLYVAQKQGGEPPPMKTLLTTFHGQAPIREPIERIYPAS